jgi:hypothetical protein
VLKCQIRLPIQTPFIVTQSRDVFKYYNYVIVVFSHYVLVVCKGEWSVYGVCDIISACVASLCLLDVPYVLL